VAGCRRHSNPLPFGGDNRTLAMSAADAAPASLVCASSLAVDATPPMAASLALAASTFSPHSARILSRVNMVSRLHRRMVVSREADASTKGRCGCAEMPYTSAWWSTTTYAYIAETRGWVSMTALISNMDPNHVACFDST